jgi:ABC-type nitrate/sulfonate/bicarbonate transport system permease component
MSPRSENDPYRPSQYVDAASVLPATRRELIWRSAKLGAKLAFWIFGGISLLSWAAIAGIGVYKSVRYGVSPMLVLEKLGGVHDVVIHLGATLLGVAVGVAICGAVGAIIGAIASLFPRSMRAVTPESEDRQTV